MVQSYCSFRNLPPSLKGSVMEYFRVRAAQRAICDEEQVLAELSPPLKAQVTTPPPPNQIPSPSHPSC